MASSATNGPSKDSGSPSKNAGVNQHLLVRAVLLVVCGTLLALTTLVRDANAGTLRGGETVIDEAAAKPSNDLETSSSRRVLTSSSIHVVMVHGLAGWGPSELLSINYWGGFGFENYQGTLGASHKNFQGTTVQHIIHQATVGPMSSNWDRACELYAQITGTQVDYGAAHSTANSHNRLGKDYSSAGPMVSGWSATNPVALVGHSMGGNTIRMLEKLLRDGAPAEVAATGSGAGTSDLFKGGKAGWIKSLHTISTPHSGSPLHTALGPGLIDKIKNLIIGIAALAEAIPFTSAIYDLKLDHFNLTKNSGESISTYVDRLLSSPVFSPTFRDAAHFDLGPQGCYEFSRTTNLANSDTFYFSHATFQTFKDPFSSNEIVDVDIEALMAPTGTIIGTIGNNGNKCNTGVGSFCYDSTWNKNDGLVPLKSADTPRIGFGNAPAYVGVGVPNPKSRSNYYQCTGSGCGFLWLQCCDKFSGSVPKGAWVTQTHERDHIQVIGFETNLLLIGDQSDGIYDQIREELDLVAVR
jgi:triacylglycerol lipase